TVEKYDMIFEATGRRANTGRLGLEAAGVALDEKGFIKTDTNMATNVPGIYAAGDCIPTPMLAYTASREAFAVVEHIAKGAAGDINYTNVPKLVFSSPQLGSIGLSQAKAAELNIPVKIYRYFFKAIGKAVVEDRDAGLIKLIEDTRTSTIIGACAVGEEITEIINELTVIIGAGVKTNVLKNCVHVHPSYAEIITEALSFGG
ncbi:MAG: FAD-dependent oxidoreductase, partial [Candidatus Goldiibacteriota bacterium]